MAIWPIASVQSNIEAWLRVNSVFRIAEVISGLEFAVERRGFFYIYMICPGRARYFVQWYRREILSYFTISSDIL